MTDFIKTNIDLHMHGLYSGAVSDKMIPKVIAEQAPLKGLNVVGSSDILNGRWVTLIKEQLKENKEGLLEAENGTKFILQTEVEDKNRVHHIILFPSFSKVEEVKEKLKKYCKDFESDGRPKIGVGGEELVEVCNEAETLVGFSHAFTPYFGLFAKFNSYKDCYGSKWNKVHFLELGLSADTNMADRISELHNLTFTSNSDAHSPWPNKLGREFNTLRIKEENYGEIVMALKRENGRKCILNAGFNPLEGKYHKTRCTGCLRFFDPKEAEKLKWKCDNCKKSIKKGVDYRIEELSDSPLGEHPEHRPLYKHIIPLSEIIALSLNINNSWSIKVQNIWQKFVNKFGNEADILLNIEIDRLKEFDENIGNYIELFRNDKIEYISGGAGVYGKLLKPGDRFVEDKTKVQRNLKDF